jgi:hypothetical protein
MTARLHGVLRALAAAGAGAAEGEVAGGVTAGAAVVGAFTAAESAGFLLVSAGAAITVLSSIIGATFGAYDGNESGAVP